MLVILGFIINSLTMTIQRTTDKVLGLKTVCTEFLRATTLSIIGRIVASFPGVVHGPLFYRHLEKDKCLALQQAKGNFDAHMSLSQQPKGELQWWYDDCPQCDYITCGTLTSNYYRSLPLRVGEPNMTVYPQEGVGSMLKSSTT